VPAGFVVTEHYRSSTATSCLQALSSTTSEKSRKLGAATSIDYTDEGRLIGHLSLGVSMVDEKLAAMESFP